MDTKILVQDKGWQNRFKEIGRIYIQHSSQNYKHME